MSLTKSVLPRTRDLIQRLASGVSSAQAGYEVWFTLLGKDKAYEQYSEELRDHLYRDFFDSVIDAHLKLMFIEIACLFDHSKRASSFHKLRALLEKETRDDLVARIDCELLTHRDLIEKIKGIRDKLVAHHDMTWTHERVYKEYGVSPNDISTLLNALNELMKIIYKCVVSHDTAYPIARPGRFEEATFRLLYVLRRMNRAGFGGGHFV